MNKKIDKTTKQIEAIHDDGKRYWLFEQFCIYLCYNILFSVQSSIVKLKTKTAILNWINSY